MVRRTFVSWYSRAHVRPHTRTPLKNASYPLEGEDTKAILHALHLTFVGDQGHERSITCVKYNDDGDLLFTAVGPSFFPFLV